MKKILLIILLSFITFKTFPTETYKLNVYKFSGTITKVDVEKRFSILFIDNKPFVIENFQYFYFLQLKNRKITVLFTIVKEIDVSYFEYRKVYGYWFE